MLEVMREHERLKTTGLSRVQWWRLERAGKVPRRVQLSANSVGWLRHEIEAWLKARAEQRKGGR
jgi:prophage regulatory protein